MKLEEFEALEKAATPGPWKALPPGYRGDTVSGYMDVCAVVQLKPDELDDKYSIQDLEENDANFIAACREMVPKMIRALQMAKKRGCRGSEEFSEPWLSFDKAMRELEQP